MQAKLDLPMQYFQQKNSSQRNEWVDNSIGVYRQEQRLIPENLAAEKAK